MKRLRKVAKQKRQLDELTICLEVVTASFLNARKTLESMLPAIESASDNYRGDYLRLYAATLNSIRHDMNSFYNYYEQVSSLHPEITKDPKVQELVGYITEQICLFEKYVRESPTRGPRN